MFFIIGVFLESQFKTILLNVEQCDNEIDDVSVPMSVNNTAVPSPNNDPIS